MTKPNDPREFWIISEQPWSDKNQSYVALSKDELSPLSLSKAIHVIEYAAYEEMKKQL